MIPGRGDANCPAACCLYPLNISRMYRPIQYRVLWFSVWILALFCSAWAQPVSRPGARKLARPSASSRSIPETNQPARPLLRQEEPKGWVWVTQTVDISQQLGGEQNIMTLDGEPLPSMIRKRVTLGLVLDEEGHIATRLIDVSPQSPPTAVTVRSIDTKPVAAKFLGMDLVSGLCILKVEKSLLKTAAFHLPEPLPTRLNIRLYGFHPNQRMNLSSAIILSSPRRNIYSGQVAKALGDFRYQPSNPIYYLVSPPLTAVQDGSLILGPGNAVFGMALYDSSGQGKPLVYTISRIKNIAQSIIQSRQSLAYGWFGATGMDATVGPPSATYQGSVDDVGVRIIAVAPDSPAEMAGVKPKDILLSVNDRRILNYAQLATVIRQLPPDCEITVRIKRGQEIKVLKSKLVPAPSIEPEQQLIAFAQRLETMEEQLRAMPATDPNRPKLESRIDMMRIFVGAVTTPAPPDIRLRVFYGIEIQPLTGQLLSYFAANNGVLIASVQDKSKAGLGGLKAGDIVVKAGGQPISDLASLLNALDKGSGPTIPLTVIRHREEKTLQLPR